MKVWENCREICGDMHQHPVQKEKGFMSEIAELSSSDKRVISLAKTILFYLYFRSILMISHLFLYYFIHSDLYFIPILPDRENRATWS